jgi:hypothetical protein
MTPSRPSLTATPMIGYSGAPLEHLVHPAVCSTLGFGAKRLHVLEPTFFANGAEVGGVRERALGSPTHPLAHRGAWRRKTGRGSSAPPLPDMGRYAFGKASSDRRKLPSSSHFHNLGRQSGSRQAYRIRATGARRAVCVCAARAACCVLRAAPPLLS